ncbi:LysR family transcriptional regulator [Poseidonocella sp. HB161398]|uniref:LysR family transcriptional regulator n=1 Tax=Poseidonocella sp. HB161398 TaxID=2320855 RepID=UPI0011099CDF|nr:LysR family transcriptional regulator [Poseidonocella sp. HB161398]
MGEIEELRVFLAVAREASFAGAARTLGLPAPSVTRAVAALEARLGVQLFLRTTRRVSLTPAGADYAAQVAPLLEGLGSAAEELRERHGDLAGLIRLNAPIGFGAETLPAAIASFRREHPQVTFSVLLSDSFVDSVDDSFDLAIRISVAPRDAASIWRRICRVDRILAAAPDYLEARGVPAHPDDLADHACIGHDVRARGESWELRRDGAVARIRAGAELAANNAALMAGLALAGQGIVMLPRFMLEADLDRGALVRVLPGWQPPELWLTLYYPPLERIPARLKLFSEHVERHVTQSGKFGS